MEHTTRPLTAETQAESDKPLVRRLSRAQRRVLGVLVEKGLTTPEYYPLTRKAAATGCNQKSNRSPLTNYSEDAVEETLDELRQLGLVAVVHTESGRTERYRHFMRQRYPFTETQLAIITELLLRGSQQLGELRSRASRMVPIESLEQLRSDLQELTAQGYVRADGPLDRRGIEVDHTFYEPGEQPRSEGGSASTARAAASAAESHAAANRSEPAARASSSDGDARLAALERECAGLRNGLLESRQQIDALRDEFARLNDEFADLRRDLGG